MKTNLWMAANAVVLSLACRPAEDLPPPPIDSIGDTGAPRDPTGGTTAYDDTGTLDDTGTDGGSTCDPDAAELVCRGFAVGVYVDPDGTETIDPGGMGVRHLCIDPVDYNGVDPSNTYQDIRMCAPWHGIDLLDCENPNDVGEQALCDDLAERCRVRCEIEASFPVEVEAHTLDRVECILSISNDVGYGGSAYNPECSYSELLRVDHRFPRQQDAPGEDYKPCSLESCSTAECSGYDPIGGVGLTRGLRQSQAVIDRELLDDLRVDPLALWECDPGRYAEIVTPAPDSTSPHVEWRFEDLAPGSLWYELGLRNGDANARVWAHDPSTGSAITPVYELDSVEGLAAAYSVLLHEPHLTLAVERSRASKTQVHTVRVAVKDGGLDLDEDGETDIVVCPDP